MLVLAVGVSVTLEAAPLLGFPEFPDLSGHSGLFTPFYPALESTAAPPGTVSSLGLTHPSGSCCPALTSDRILHTLMKLAVQTFPLSSRASCPSVNLTCPFGCIVDISDPAGPSVFPSKLTSPLLPVPLNGATIRPLPSDSPGVLHLLSSISSLPALLLSL